MEMKYLISTLTFTLIFTGCSFAPLTTPTSGRSIGDGKWQINGSILPALGVTAGYGVTKNFDAGILIERQFGLLYSAWGKYSLVNNSEGFAASIYGGAFYGAGFGTSRGVYAGPIFSFKKKWFETYLSLRYATVSWDIQGITQENADDSLFDFSFNQYEANFGYLQTDLGFNFWFTESFAWNINGKLWTFFNDDIDSSTSSVIPGTALIFEF